MVVIPKDSSGVSTAVIQYVDQYTGRLSKPIASVVVDDMYTLTERTGQRVTPETHAAFARIPFYQDGRLQFAATQLPIAPSQSSHNGFVALMELEWADMNALQHEATSFFLEPRNGGERIELQRLGENTPLRVAHVS
jgi:hypothetical protein